MAWKDVSEEEAAKAPYYGLGGWLLIFYAIALTVVADGVLSAAGAPRDLFALSDANAAQDRVILIVRGVLFAPFLVLAPLKHPLTPKIAIACNWLAAIAIVIDGAIVGMDYLIPGFAATLILAVVITFYFRDSKRVNATYFWRLPDGAVFGSADHRRARRNAWFAWALAAIIVGLFLIDFTPG